MRVNLWRGAFAVAFGIGLLSCTEPTGPTAKETDLAVRATVAVTPPALVISQVYGGGGNSGATLKNDFIEVFNPGTSPVNATGWSVQYASSTGITWQVTALSGTIPAGGYYLIQEAALGGGTVSLPTPDAAATINMSGTAGKVALASSTVALTGACPTSGALVDQVGYGSGTLACQAPTGTLSSTTAALRGTAGCTYTASISADFVVGTPNPRNSATTLNPCGTVTPPAVVTSVTVAPDSASIVVGNTQSFAATARDASDNTVTVTFKWTTNNAAVATVDSVTGVATGVTAGTAFITATTPNAVAATAKLIVTAAPPPVVATGDVVISQIYGGGGNSGAPLTNDYIELFNRGTDPAIVDGWTVQYAGSTTSTWQSTTLSGTILPGHYYLVQEAAGTGSPAALPTPDATGAIAMGAGAGKVLIALPGTVVSGSCPTGTGIVDHVGYGTASNCALPWGGTTPTLFNTTAAFRKNDGCVKTGSVTDDFIDLPPNPHNSSSTKNCAAATYEQSSATLVINELMSDPANAESASWGEWFEVQNYGAQPINLKGWKIISGGTSQPDHTIATDVIVPAGGFAVLGRGGDPTRNGGVTLDYSYFTGNATTIWLDDTDYLMLIDTDGKRADSVAWTSASVAHGVTRALRDESLPHANVDGANWAYSTTNFGDGDYGTPDAANTGLADTAPLVSNNKITITGRISTDAPIPVEFEAQIFASETTSGGLPVAGATFTFSSLTPAFASIDDRGVIHGIAEGTARFRILANDGAVRVHTLFISTPVASATAQYLDNEAFGEPTDADASDDFIIHRPQYTTSFNGSRGIPNWVAYDLNRTDIAAGQDRCNCFTFDPELIAAGFTRYTTADYTGAGTFAGYGIDRGHMTRSFDRTSGTLDNARTFYFSNVVPQAADLNQGPWAIFENFLGDLATTQNKEVYIYVGPAGSIGTVKNEGKITIPKYTWKIALVLPRGAGLADVHDYRDVQQVIAVVMPNTPGVRNVDWSTNYVVTVDSVEKLTHYKFLSALDARTQRALKTNTKPPLGSLDGPYNAAENTSVNMSGAGSIDPNGSIVSYQWNFGDGNTGSGATVSHTYTNYGSYSVRMIVTDNDGLVDTVATTATIPAQPPTAGVDGPYSSHEGSSVSMSAASSSDPDGTLVSYEWDFGDGSTGSGSSVSHTYAHAGSYTVKVTVTDNDGLANTATTTAIIAPTPPVAAVDGPYSANEGSSVSMSSAGSSDANGSIVSYAWDFGDGSTGSGSSVSHTYATYGSYNVRLIVTDNDGWANTVATTATVANVAPVVQPFSGATILPGESYSANGSFTDPGAETWSATVDYGDGSGTQSLSLLNKTFSLSHTFTAVGSFTTTASVSDGQLTGTGTAIVTVLSPLQGVGSLQSLLNQLIANGTISQGNGGSLSSKLSAASKQLALGNNTAAINQLQAFMNEVNAMVQSGRLSAAQGNALEQWALRIIAATGI